MVQGHGGVLLGIAGDLQHVPPDDPQRVSDDRDLVAVLLDILGQGVSHQAPAADIAHTREVGKEIIAHWSFSDSDSAQSITRQGRIFNKKPCK